MNNFITPCLNYSEQWAFLQQIQVFSEVIYQTSEMSMLWSTKKVQTQTHDRSLQSEVVVICTKRTQCLSSN